MSFQDHIFQVIIANDVTNISEDTLIFLLQSKLMNQNNP